MLYTKEDKIVNTGMQDKVHGTYIIVRSTQYPLYVHSYFVTSVYCTTTFSMSGSIWCLE